VTADPYKIDLLRHHPRLHRDPAAREQRPGSTALQQPEGARYPYERALALAKTIEPEFQVGWIPTLEHKLARN